VIVGERWLQQPPLYIDDQLTTVLSGATAAAVPTEGEDKQFNGSCQSLVQGRGFGGASQGYLGVYAKEGVWNLEKVMYT